MANSAIKVTMGPVEWAMVVALSLVWGGAFFFGGVAVAELPPLTIVFFRVFLGALTLWAVVIVCHIPVPKDMSLIAAFFGMSLLNNVIPFSLIVWGQTHIASGLASILNATTPLFTVLVAHVLTTDERFTPNRVIGVLAGFAGVAIMIGGAALETAGIGVFAQFAVLGAALSYSFAGVFGRRFRRLGVSPVMTATGQVTASSLILLPLMLFVDQPWTLPVPSLPVVGSLIGFGVLSTALAYILFFRILSAAGATNLSIVTFLIPVSAIVLGIVFLDETLAPRHLIGMAMIGVGLACIDGRLLRVFRRSAPV
ncbi:MAG: DMT family transporter [Alphaproteobacteria bacterium]